ncbi:hypothetical protein AW118_23910 [Escherichia coli]|nr:hypothetical protein AW073_24730 [Escherichia coli]BDI39270.1 hypothetical protein EsCdI10290_05495 [Escherichia sp. 10290]BDI49095.1 hypothetical protein EsCd1HHP049_05347 [Escherichia sp. HH154_1D]BDI53917.1 hypothetical protein EsCd1KSP079_05370 [Escherichia sp. KS167_9B]OTE56548.1 hypothetical protein AW118_23910 [Escherichia coli]
MATIKDSGVDTAATTTTSLILVWQVMWNNYVFRAYPFNDTRNKKIPTKKWGLQEKQQLQVRWSYSNNDKSATLKQKFNRTAH